LILLVIIETSPYCLPKTSVNNTKTVERKIIPRNATIEAVTKDLLPEKLAEYLIPRVFTKPPNLKTYEGTTNPDEHVAHLDTFLDYHQARYGVNRKLFVLTQKGVAMTWFKDLEDNSINSWKKLCGVFTSHFTTRRKQPKTMEALNTIV